MSQQMIGSNDHYVYANIHEINDYAAGAIHATAWSAASEALQEQAAVTATRLLDRQRWGDAYNTFDLRLAVPDIVTAAMELAIALINGTDVQNDANQNQKIAALSAGSVSISYFRGSEGQVGRFPLIVMELLRDYLGSSNFIIGKVTGVCGESITNKDYGHTEGM